jgi:hypothetical protein
MKSRSRKREASHRSLTQARAFVKGGRYRGRARAEGVTFFSALYLRAAVCRFAILLKTPMSAFMSSLRKSESDFLCDRWDTPLP